METIEIAATERTPEIHFDFENNEFSIRGESFPEDVSEFYTPLTDPLEAHLAALKGATVRFTFEFIYFNSSSAKVLVNLFASLDEAAEAGNDVTVVWVHDEDDDNMRELGEEFAEDLETATFEFDEKVSDA